MRLKFFSVLIMCGICIAGFSATRNEGFAGLENFSAKTDTVRSAGNFLWIKSTDGVAYRAYAAGPENAGAAILVVHDYFGVTPATIETVERLGRMGYRTVAVDLYKGKSANTGDSATAFMKAKVRKETDLILQAGIDYLKRPGRKLASLGFSAGGVDAMNANLMDPQAFSATVIIYGGDYDKIDKSSMEKLKSPVLAITGSLDEWPVQAALNFFANEKSKSIEIYIYPGVGHAYAQPLFLNGKNYDPEATRVTWNVMDDFLSRHLKN
jgi:carboxymethylenebutenolidase